MARLVSNGGGKDTVRAAFEEASRGSRALHLAAPYFSYPDPILAALRNGASVQLLVGLNSATHPEALRAVIQHRAATIRFYTARFHAKLYVFDKAALVGSANLTDAGFQGNREVVAWLTDAQDPAALDEARVVFAGLWDGARALTPGTVAEFELAWRAARRTGPDADAAIAEAVGKVQPPTVSVEKQNAAAVQVAKERLRRQMQEEYVPAFAEVAAILRDNDLYRPDVHDIAPPFRVNRFLNWVRLTHVPGDTWDDAPLLTADARRDGTLHLAREWRDAADGRVFEGYAEGIQGVLLPFSTLAALAGAGKEVITKGLLGIHAFQEQLRFTPGGLAALPDRFWGENGGDVDRVRGTLQRLLHGPGDMVDRLHEVTNDPRYALRLFGKFCGLELLGTVKSDECPPVNGRTAKALRYLGHKVTAT